MTITLRQESQAGTTLKGSSLTYAELDNNFIDLLTNKILPLQVNADTGVVTVGQAQSNGVFSITGSTGLNTAVTEDSAGNANLVIGLDQVSGSNLNVTLYAKCSEAISVGDVVMFAGVQGDHLLVKKAVIDDSAGSFESEYIVGIAADNYALNDFAYIVTQGQITHANLNTNSYAPGTILWYDPTTSGGWTATEPTAPNPKVKVAAVLKQSATDGILLVRPTFSKRLTEAEDVETAGAANNDYLIYNSAAGKWQHTPLDISTDTTPQLGGALDTNGNAINFGDNDKATFGDSEDLWIYHDGGTTNIYERGTGNLRIITNSTLSIDGVSGGEFMASFVSNGAVSLYYDNGKKFETTSTGILTTGTVNVNNAYSLPTADGTSGQVLTTNGTGTLSFTTVPDTQIVAGDNITITQPDSASGWTVAFRNPLNQPVVAGDQTFSQINFKDYSETIYTSGTTTGTITPDVANGNVQRITLSGNITFDAFSSPAAGQSMTLIVQQPASGGPYTLSSTMKFAGGSKTLSTGASEWDIITVFYDGTNYFASLSTNFS